MTERATSCRSPLYSTLGAYTYEPHVGHSKQRAMPLELILKMHMFHPGVDDYNGHIPCAHTVCEACGIDYKMSFIDLVTVQDRVKAPSRNGLDTIFTTTSHQEFWCKLCIKEWKEEHGK